MLLDEIYKKDTLGNIRKWYVEIDGNKYRTHAGQVDGKIVTSGWQIAEVKNEGKANATTPEEQALSEVNSKYEHQLAQGGYFKTYDLAVENKPSFFKPMLAKKYEDEIKKVTFPVWSQPKLDGVRCIATIEGLFSRNGKPLVATPHIHEALMPLFDKNPGLVLDGEMYNHDLRRDFDKIISLVRKSKPKPEDIEESSKYAQYHIYDVHGVEEIGSRNEFLCELIRGLQRNREEVGLDQYCIDFVKARECINQELLDELYGEYLEDGYEGQMVRLSGYGYENKRSKSLLKRKEFLDEEFEIISVEEGKGNWAGYVKFAHIKLEDGTTQKTGVRGNFETLGKMLKEADDYVGGQVTVRYQNRTPDNKLRFPVAKAFYKSERDM